MNSESSKSLTIDFAIILSILTGFSYLLSFLFYAGQFTYYKVPWFLIDINLSNILYSILLLSPYVFIYTWDTVRAIQRPNRSIKQEANQVDVLSRKTKKKKVNKFKYLLLILLIVSISIGIFINNSLLFGLIFGFITSYIITFSIRLYKKKNYAYMTILFFIVYSAYSYTLGYSVASWTTTHTIVEENNKTYVALTVYKEQFVISPFNRKTKKYNNEYKLIEIKDVISFQQEDVGKIKMKK